MADNKNEPEPVDPPQQETRLDDQNMHSLYDEGPDPLDVARRLGLTVPDTTGNKE